MRLWRSIFRARGLLRDLRGIRAALDQQNLLLARLADKFAPALPQTDRATVEAETGVDYVDAADQAIIQDYVNRTARDTGRPPNDDEILIYLADEKTRDLHTRLLARDQELDRLAQERQR
jgi:hypothetical protein